MPFIVRVQNYAAVSGFLVQVSSQYNSLEKYLASFYNSSMYNYHLFAQEDRRVELLQKNEDEQQRYKELKAKKEREMISNHEKRVEYSILRLIDQPTRISIYRNPIYRPRDPHSHPLHPDMHFNYEPQESRIKRSLHRNATLDLVPFKNCSSHCFRARPQIEKSEKKWRKGQSQSQEIAAVSFRQGEKELEREEKPIVIEEGRQVEIYPKFVKHPKAYFHTFETIANQADSLKIFMRENQRKGQNGPGKGREDSDPFQYLMQMPLFEKMNGRKENIKKVPLKVLKCKQALAKCGLLGQPNGTKKQYSSQTQR